MFVYFEEVARIFAGGSSRIGKDEFDSGARWPGFTTQGGGR
jgi:hypothetical protein